MLFHLLHESLDLRPFADIGWDGDGLALGAESIQSGACLFTGFGFAGGNEDLRAASLEEAVYVWSAIRAVSFVFLVLFLVPRCSVQP